VAVISFSLDGINITHIQSMVVELIGIKVADLLFEFGLVVVKVDGFENNTCI